jgi:parallel beta-helix repeat protein
MRAGQRDIDVAPSGTTFCLSGTHNWTLTPKSGDRFIGPGILDGADTATFGILGNRTSNVTLANLEIRNYRAGDQKAAISAHGTKGWVFRDLQVHDNGSSAGGTGANLGVDSRVIGGRYYNNRSLGIGGGGGANGWVIDGAEIDHNNFTNDTYTKRNISCGYEGGGVKWTADNTTVKNSTIHDNACKGLWADLNGDNTTIVNNDVYGNWDEGIFIEISSGAVVTGNTVSGNGYKTGSGSGCSWLWGGGITFASSDHAEIAHNVLSGNCNGITGTQQTRQQGHPGLLENLSIHDNTVTGPGGKSGVAADNGADLKMRSIVFANNAFTNSGFCGLEC